MNKIVFLIKDSIQTRILLEIVLILNHLLILSIIQGFTEFLPISSSSHLIIIPKIMGWPDQGLVFDVAVHVGTLGAVIIYFLSLIHI